MPQSSAPPACPSDAELVELVEGRLQGPAIARLEEHVSGCSACAAFLRALAPEEVPGALSPTARLDLEVARNIVGDAVPDGPTRPDLDRKVALKILHTARGTARAQARLVREARALGKLSHPNVVQVHDVGEHEGDVFVAMELVEGEPLDAWCRGPSRPTWREVLEAYLDAARGLAAAHAKGIVHRDVKPSNILRGKDGRVCVADFGLAAGRPRVDAAPPERPESQPLPEAIGAKDRVLEETLPMRSDSSDDGAGLTATDTLLGTPLYMAPEQFDAPEVGPAADQHSLCTALHEGLYGRLPFDVPADASRVAVILARKKEGPPASPPPGSVVPAWVFRAVARGLAARPDDRFPSMAALVDALREPEQPRRARFGAWLAITALLAGVVTFAALRRGAFEDPCAHPERQLAGAWDGEARGRVRTAFAGTGRAYAMDTADRVSAILDAYADGWTAMRREVCEASLRGTQRREVALLRDECLERRLGQVRALTGLLGEKPDGDVLDKSVQAAAGLTPVASCADIGALTARVRPPEDPSLKARVAALEPRVDRLEALFVAGKFQEGLRDGEPLLADAAGVAYAPLRARVEFWVGLLHKATGDHEGAKALLREAASSAARGRDEDLSARAWTDLLVVVVENQRRLEEGAIVRALGRTALERTADPVAQARWANAEGLLLWRMGKHAEARTALERSIGLFTKAVGPDHPEVANALNSLGAVVSTAGAYTEARSLLERAAAIREKAQGPDHPETARALTNLGVTLTHLGEYERAIAIVERALASREKSLGPEHRDVAYSLVTLGEARNAMRDFQGAASFSARALAIREKAYGPDHPAVAAALANLGHARAHLGELDAARPLLERALAIREKAQGASHPEVSEPLLYLGDLALTGGRPAEAVPPLERALALRDPDTESEVELALAEALWRIGKDHARAAALAESARARYAGIGNRPGQERAARWLADHPG
jgi:serine/threonine-protein kinase